MISMKTLRCRGVRSLFAVGVAVIVSTLLLMVWKPCNPPSSSCMTPVTSLKMTLLQSMTPVYVVEEHHEVLLYWFDAAAKGHIKTQGNVLLHIDGHSDAAPPERRDVLPFLRQPTLRDIYNMMQRNDEFIQAAGISGLINRYIWVRPPFDVAEPVGVDHHIVNVQFGTTNRTNIIGKLIEDICACVKTSPEGILTSPGWTCAMVGLEKLNKEPEPMQMQRESCNIKIDNGLMEIVTETKAIELLKSGNWITSLDSVILDIDEDYYGCEPAVMPLYDVNVTENMLLKNNYYISHLFCPTQPKEELEADKFYASLLDTVMHLKRFCLQVAKVSHTCKNKHAMKQFLLNKTDDFFADIVRRKLKPILCRSDAKAKRIISRLLESFLSCTPQQLKVLQEIGICFLTSPRTLVFDPTMGMKTCDGFNRPNDSVVPFHTPTPDEVTFRTSQLKVMLSSEGLHPGVVTVCRSMRDGYTPRKFFHRIEKDVLGILKDVFSSIDDTSVFYDPYLLGGASGWPGRH